MEFYIENGKSFIKFSDSSSFISNKDKPISEIKMDIKDILSKIYNDSTERDLDRMADLIFEFDNKLNGENDGNNVLDISNNIDENNTSQDSFSFDPVLKTLHSKSSGINRKLKFKREALDDNNNYENDENEDNLTYKPITLKSLNEKYPNINWKLYLEERFEVIDMKEYVRDDLKVVLSNEAYIDKLNKILNEVDTEALSYYLEW